MNWLQIEDQGVVMVERIVAVGPAESAAMKRLLAALPLHKIISLAGGRRRQTVLVLDSDHVVITALPLGQLVRQLAQTGWRQG